MADSGSIRKFMRSLLDDYRQLRGKSKNSLCKPFWDAVVITTADVAQKEAYQLQIDDKVARNELPLDLPILVVSDPPGIRIGNGGSTFVALEFLETTYGSDIYKMKILMIHAGGWSQRMPSATVLGKIFSLLPHGNPPYQMLDLKLALYWPLVDKMEPGVFLVCADDFLVYSFMSSNNWKIPAQGFTALAHPSPMKVGRSHGVYVIKNVSDMDASIPVDIRECLEVLQKPSDARMKAQGALLKGDSHVFADGICIDGEVVYTDSSFYFGTDVMEKLLHFKKSVGDLSCEIDAYGDFLQAVGPNATNEYIHLTSNVSQQTSNLLEMRQRVFDCLNGSDIHVLVLNASAFIHIGTTTELLHHFCRDEIFQSQMAFEKDIFNLWKEQSDLQQNSDDGPSQELKPNGHNVSPSACIIHSILNDKSEIEYDSIIECCDFEPPVQISVRCIVSNCQLSSKELTIDATKLTIPYNTFLHTVPIIVKGHTKFVTIFFHIFDDLKKSIAAENVESLPFLHSIIAHFLKNQGLTKEDILPQNSQEFCNNDTAKQTEVTKSVSLWNLKLYPAQSSMTASLEEALSVLIPCNDNKKCPKMSRDLFSLSDLLKFKDIRSMLNFRKSLFDRISKSCH